MKDSLKTYYSVYNGKGLVKADQKNKVVVIGSGPIRIGQVLSLTIVLFTVFGL